MSTNALQNPSASDYRRLLEVEWRLEKAACKNYRMFFKQAWPELEPTSSLRHNWHIDVLCDELQRQAERIAAGKKKEYDIIINIPPGSSKSTIVRRLFIPWVWTRFPGQKFITASFDKGLSLDHAVDSRTVIMSEWYKRHWGDIFQLKFDQNVKGYFKNSAAGFCLAVSVTSSSIGRRCDWTIIDDPNDPKKDEVPEQRMSVINWFSKTIYKRLNNAEIGQRLIVQQRTHENDLTGYLLANYPKDFKLFCIPGEESDDVSPPELRKYYVSGLFDPVNYSRVTLADDKKKLGPDYYGQIMQRPSPAEGGIFKKQWWRFWKPKGTPTLREIAVRVDQNIHICPCFDLPDQFDDKIISWDMGLKGNSDNNPSAGHIWGQAGPNYYLLDRSHGHYNDLQMEQEARRLKMKHPNTSRELIEDAAAGPTVIRRLQIDTSGVLGINPKGSKRNRARTMTILAESGNIYLPHPDLAPWVNQVIDEFSLFDSGDHDDDVDAATQAINHFMTNRRIFKEYNGQRKKFTIAWNELSTESKPIIAQFMERNGQSYILIALYNEVSGILRILAEAAVNNSNPEAVLPIVTSLIDSIGAKFLGLRRFSWYGNNLMFAAGCGDVAELYMMKKVFVQEVPAYNDSGAIQRVIQKLTGNKFFIHERAPAVCQEILSWSYKDTKDKVDQTEDGFCLARTVCLISEVISMNTPMVSMPKKNAAYSKERTKFLEELKNMTEKQIIYK